jgi:hypothetical protein
MLVMERKSVVLMVPRIIAAIAVAAIVFYGESAAAQPCPGPNALAIHDGPIELSYESWVRPPREPDSVYSYGRCINTLNKRSIIIDWIGTQLKGPVTDKVAQYAAFPFFDGKWSPAPSDLLYELPKIAKNQKHVMFMASAVELDQQRLQPSAINSVNRWREAMRAGRPVPDAVRDAASSARIPIVDDGGEQTAVLVVTFVSTLSPETRYSYVVRYALDRGSRDAPSARGLSLRPAAEFLRAALRRKYDVPAVRLVKPDDAVQFEATSSGPATMRIDKIELLQGDAIIATFPMSYYAPAEATGR